MMRKVVTCLFLVAALLVFVGGAHAALTLFTDRTGFTSQGVIVENYGFEDITGSSYYLPGQPWTAHGVTYNALENLIGLPGFYGTASNIIINNYWTPLPGTISDNYTMFGFDLGVLGSDYLLDLSITTNLSTYTYNGLVVPNVNTHTMDFYGFVAGAGEYFSSFNLTSQTGSGSAPALDNVTLGTAGAVPIPGAVWLLGSGLLGLGGWRRFRKN